MQSIMKEEAFHMFQQYVLANEYPAQFGLAWTATHCLANKQANCNWWLHPENIGCRDIGGATCTSPDATTACTSTAGAGGGTGACSTYNQAGQCVRARWWSNPSRIGALYPP